MMRTYDEVRIDCRCCGVDLLKGEWLSGVCRRCVISIERLIICTKRRHYVFGNPQSRIDV